MSTNTEDYPSLADVASGKVKAKPVDDEPPAAAAAPAAATPADAAAPLEKGKEEAN